MMRRKRQTRRSTSHGVFEWVSPELTTMLRQTRVPKSGDTLRPLLLGAICLTLLACAGPVRAVRVDPKEVRQELSQSAISTGEPSWATRNVLFERGLFGSFSAQPETALATLHQDMIASGGDPDLLFALSELSFLH